MPLVEFVRTRVGKGEWKQSLGGAYLLLRYYPRGLMQLLSGRSPTKQPPTREGEPSHDQTEERLRGQELGSQPGGRGSGKAAADGGKGSEEVRRLRRRNRRLTAQVQALEGQLKEAGGSKHSPPVGGVHFGSLRRVTPISREFGFDRGQPIDRYYIEAFLARHARDIQGRVLEIGDASYTRRFGGNRVTHSDVLHVTEGNPQATIVADLTHADNVPSDAFDCVILTQTLHLIYDVRSAIRTVGRILKPGGVLLATFPGISQISTDQWGKQWYWAFTAQSARRLFEEVFPEENVDIEANGNVLAAISFLHGLAVEELDREELDKRAPGYEVLITLRAVKADVKK